MCEWDAPKEHEVLRDSVRVALPVWVCDREDEPVTDGMGEPLNVSDGVGEQRWVQRCDELSELPSSKLFNNGRQRP